MTEDAEIRAYMQGVADAGARLLGCVAAELGPDHPLVARMITRLGQLGHDEDDEDVDGAIRADYAGGLLDPSGGLPDPWRLRARGWEIDPEG